MNIEEIMNFEFDDFVEDYQLRDENTIKNKNSTKKLNEDSMPINKRQRIATDENNKLITKVISMYHNDLILSYPRIIADSINTGNMRHFTNIMNKYCTTDAIWIKQFTGLDNNNLYGPNYREVSGATAIILYLNSILTSIPDFTWDLRDYKSFAIDVLPDNFQGLHNEIYKFQNKSPKLIALLKKLRTIKKSTNFTNEYQIIVGKYEVTGTKLYDISLADNNTLIRAVNPIENSLENSSQNSSKTSFESIFENESEYEMKNERIRSKNVSLQNHNHTKKLDLNNKQFAMNGIFIWAINSDEKIVRFEHFFSNE